MRVALTLVPEVLIEDLCINYGATVAVDHLSFSADSGQVTVVLGPNGAGKTSTIECCEGYRTPSSGTVRVHGLDPKAQHGELVHHIGVMLQGGGLQSGIRPIEALRQFAAFYNNPIPPEELLELVGLVRQRNTAWSRLSGGEKQRLSLGLALIGRPAVAFLDEPSAGVDLQGRLLIRSLIGELRSDGVCIVLTTHDMDEAESLADKIVIIDRGRVVADGSADELLRTDAERYMLFSAEPGLTTEPLATQLGVNVSEVRPGEYRADLPGDPSGVAALAAALAQSDISVGDIRAGRKRLDDVVLRLTSEESTAAPPDVRSRRREPA